MVRNGGREVDVAATMADAAGQGERAAEDLKSGGTLRIVSPSNMLASDYAPDWVRRNHLVSFPWGTGDRPEHTSEQAYAEMLLRRFPRSQFSQRLGLLHDLYDVLQRHKVNLFSNIQLRLTPGDRDTMANMTPEDVALTLKIVANKLKGAAFAAALRSASPTVHTMVRKLKLVTHHLDGSGAQMAGFRSRVNSGATFFGPYTTFINMNPAELDSAEVFHAVGRGYAFNSETGDLVPLPARVIEGRHVQPRVPSMEDRWRVVASNPVVCSDFFEACAKAIREVLLCWEDGAKEQHSKDGLFGWVVDFYIKFEVSGRGCIHGHGGLTQPALQPTSVRARQTSEGMEACAKALALFVDAYCKAYLPSPLTAKFPSAVHNVHRLPDDVPLLEGCATTRLQDVEDAEDPKWVIKPWDRSHDGARHSLREMDLSRPSNDIQLHIARVVAEHQSHNHNLSCVPKYGPLRHMPPCDLNCRMVYKRRVHPSGMAFPEQGVVVLPRTGANLVKWCPAITVAWGCNNNITTAIDIDSYDAQQARSAELRAMHRQRAEAAQQHADGEDTAASAPESDSDAEEVADSTPTIESNSLKQSEYHTKYHSKPDSEGACEDLANVASRVAKRNEEDDGHEEEAAKRVLRRMANAASTQIACTAVQAAHRIQGRGDFYEAHRSVPFNLRHVAGRLRAMVPGAGDEDAAEARYTAGGDGAALWGDFDDYLHRGDKLHPMSFYSFAAHFEVKVQDKLFRSVNTPTI